MEILIGWIVVSFIIASYGDKRKIGFGVSLIVCLLLSPLIGFMCVALSDKKDDNPKPPKSTTDFDIERYRSN